MSTDSTAAASGTAAAIAVELDVLRRVEANMEWLVAAARPHCGSEPESYGISDTEDALAELTGHHPRPRTGRLNGRRRPAVRGTTRRATRTRRHPENARASQS